MGDLKLPGTNVGWRVHFALKIATQFCAQWKLYSRFSITEANSFGGAHS
jgi:hypothetical protein